MAQAAEDKKEKKALPVMLILQGVFALINLSIVGGGAYLVYASTLGWQSPKMTEKSLRAERAPASVAPAAVEAAEGHAPVAGAVDDIPAPFLHKLDKFTVNLNGEPKRVIRLEVSLEMLNEESYEEVMDITRVPKIRDRVVTILNDKSFPDLESIQGKLFLKDRITSEVNGILDKGVVKDVYFSEFVVQ